MMKVEKAKTHMVFVGADRRVRPQMRHIKIFCHINEANDSRAQQNHHKIKTYGGVRNEHVLFSMQ
jgi:hypothetical protein